VQCVLAAPAGASWTPLDGARRAQRVVSIRNYLRNKHGVQEAPVRGAALPAAAQAVVVGVRRFDGTEADVRAAGCHQFKYVGRAAGVGGIRRLAGDIQRHVAAGLQQRADGRRLQRELGRGGQRRAAAGGVIGRLQRAARAADVAGVGVRRSAVRRRRAVGHARGGRHEVRGLGSAIIGRQYAEEPLRWRRRGGEGGAKKF
jgi:hypothetical protein